MKTITLNEEAYQRLLEWKRDGRVTFSQVVLNVVPKRGTAADILNTLQQLPPLNDSAFGRMIEAYEDHRNPKNYEDAWTQ